MNIEKTKNEASDKDKMSIQFISACRHYNKALSCQRYILKVIDEYIPKHSLCQFVKDIPDRCEGIPGSNDSKISRRAEVFLQKATLACLNRIAKKNFFLHFGSKNHDIKRKFYKAYDDMIYSFEASQETLKN
mmetsp:Transcript_14635/g.22692  ORF Transcript_14635/g.22692 Transcript_14635/m.22692 type:complete len:132 (+) Transcript_14635:2054-2449(+)